MRTDREIRIRLPEALAVSIDRERLGMGLSRAGLVKLAVSDFLTGRVPSKSRRGGPPLPPVRGAVSSPNRDTFRG